MIKHINTKWPYYTRFLFGRMWYEYNWQEFMYDNKLLYKKFKKYLPKTLNKEKQMKRLNIIIHGILRVYLKTLVENIAKTGNIYELPNKYGWITICKFKYLTVENGSVRFMIIYNKDRRDKKEGKFVDSLNFTDKKYKRKILDIMKSNKDNYYTFAEFEEIVYKKQQKLEMLLNI